MVKPIKYVFLFKTPLEILLALWRQDKGMCLTDMLKLNRVKSLDSYNKYINLFIRKGLVKFIIPTEKRKYYSLTKRGRELADKFYELDVLLSK